MKYLLSTWVLLKSNMRIKVFAVALRDIKGSLRVEGTKDDVKQPPGPTKSCAINFEYTSCGKGDLDKSTN